MNGTRSRVFSGSAATASGPRWYRSSHHQSMNALSHSCFSMVFGSGSAAVL